MKIDVKNWENEVVGSVELPDDVFAREVNEHLVWEVVRAYLASRRRGTHKTKERSEVTGTRAKPWKQKHTGRARAGITPVAAVAIRWDRARPAAAVVRAEGQQEGPRAPPCAVCCRSVWPRAGWWCSSSMELDAPKTKEF